ncbi:MAG: MazG family protein [Nocardioidaceae bacterium]
MTSLCLLVTSPRVVPGLLSARAWQLLIGAEVVVCGSSSHPLVAELSAVGIDVQVLADDRPERLAAQLPAVGDASVVWLAPVDDPGWAQAFAVQLVGGGLAGTTLEVVHASHDLPGSRLLDLVEVMDRLRTQCPWDREQTHESLARYLLEEAYETLEAIDRADAVHLREELGDLLLQVVFHARLAAEDPDAPWDIDDVAAGIVDKLVRRHPHVFGTVEAADAAAVEANWESIKAAEKQRGSLLDGIPAALPALARADKVLARAAAAGLDAQWQGDDSPRARVGSTLLDAVRAARRQGVDPESALRAAVTGYEAAVRELELDGPEGG